MAAIDKCYTDSWEDYKSFLDWADGKVYTTPRGCRMVVKDIIYKWKEEDFTCERPIFNSPVHYDNYLYHNCPLEFIQDWIVSRYSDEDGLDDAITKPLAIPDYVPCTKVDVVKKGLGRNPVPSPWMVVVELEGNAYSRGCWYNEDKDFWCLPYEHDDWTCNVAYMDCSIRAIIRRILKKWKLPVGCRVIVDGRCEGDTWILETK